MQVTLGPERRIDNRNYGVGAAYHLIEHAAIVPEYGPQGLMALDDPIEAELKHCNIEIAVNFESKRQMMLRNTWREELHEPCPTLCCGRWFDL
jgi:hypothetical protein